MADYGNLFPWFKVAEPGALGQSLSHWEMTGALKKAGEIARETGNDDGALYLEGQGYADEAAEFQKPQIQRNADSRAAAAEARTVADRATAQRIGTLAASGNFAGAQAEAFKAGKPEVAATYHAFEKQAGDRAAYAEASALFRKGDAAGASEKLRSRGLLNDALALEQEKRAAEDSIRSVVRQLAESTDDEGWSTTVIPMLKSRGYDLSGLEGPEGRQLARTYGEQAEAGRGGNGSQRNPAWMQGQAKIIEQVKLRYPSLTDDDIASGGAVFQQVAAKPGNYTVQVETDGDGNIVRDGRGRANITAIQIQQPLQGSAGIAQRKADENKAWNKANQAAIQRGEMQARSEDPYEIQKSDPKIAQAQQRIDLDIKKTTPDSAYDLARAKGQGSGDAKLASTRAATLGPAIAVADRIDEILTGPGAEDAVGFITGSTAYQRLRGQVSSDMQAPEAWGRLGQNLVTLQGEVDRALAGGTGSITQGEREWLSKISTEILKAPSVRVARAYVQEVKMLVSKLLAAPSSRELDKSPIMQDARRGAVENIERAVKPPGIDPAAPRTRVYDPATRQFRDAP